MTLFKSCIYFFLTETSQHHKVACDVKKSTSHVFWQESHTEQHAGEEASNDHMLYIHIHEPNACLVVAFALHSSIKLKVTEYFYGEKLNSKIVGRKCTVDQTYIKYNAVTLKLTQGRLFIDVTCSL